MIWSAAERSGQQSRRPSAVGGGDAERKSWISKEVFDMIKEIEIRSEAQVQKINQLACKAPYEV